jgi:hypothetical protein
MTDRPDEDDDLPEFADEGIWYRFRCELCDSITETEEDVRGSVVECEVCGAKGRVR